MNGEPAPSLTMPVAVADHVALEGREVVAGVGRSVYLLLNKPAGYLSTVRDDRGRSTVLDLVPEARRLPGLVPAGRLDLGSTGLTLLTNDGDQVNRLTHPRYGVEKEYNVLLDGPLVTRAVRMLLSGVQVEAGLATAVAVRRMDGNVGEHRYSVVLVEGKKREVRHMLRAVGRNVLTLERSRLANLTLGGLARGSVRPLTAAELRGLRVAAGITRGAAGLPPRDVAPGGRRPAPGRGRTRANSPARRRSTRQR